MNANKIRLCAFRVTVLACAFFAFDAFMSSRIYAQATAQRVDEVHEFKRRVDAMWVDWDFTDNERQALIHLHKGLQFAAALQEARLKLGIAGLYVDE